MERTITLHGNPLALSGTPVAVGGKLPSFTLVDNGLKPVALADYAGKIKVIVAVPSLDTPVCDLEVRRFNQEAAALSGKVAILVVSMDLPFAQARWCGAAGVKQVQTLSDYQTAAFGESCGILIKGLRLLARAVMVVDASDTIRYLELVPELSKEPDYAAALAAVRSLA
jgi:thiol peroxidase